MKLRDKFDNPIMRHDLCRNEIEETKEQLEEIADDYAIEFEEWIRENYYDVGNSWCEWNSDKDTYSSKELLEIFKKEKGL